MHTLLETERLVLRQFTLADADNLLELNSDPDVIRFVTIDKQADPTIIQTQILPKWLQHYEGICQKWLAKFLKTAITIPNFLVFVVKQPGIIPGVHSHL